VTSLRSEFRSLAQLGTAAYAEIGVESQSCREPGLACALQSRKECNADLGRKIMNSAMRRVMMSAAISLAAGCSGSVDSTQQAAAVIPIAGGGNDQGAQPSAQAGAGGSAGGGETPSAGGPPSAGAGGAPLAGACPAVVRYSTATIRADFELSEADAQHGFSVCRNSECYNGQLNESGSWSHNDPAAAPISLVVLDEGGSKYALLSWSHHPEPDDYTIDDTFRLSFTTVPEAAPTTLIDTQVRYEETVDTRATAGIPHPELCGSWGEAMVDLRKGHGAP
jgi:hypothetical protein